MKRVKIRPVSQKRQWQNKLYASLRLTFLEECPGCQFQDCRQQATDIHHRRGREGDNFLNTKTWMAVCRHHHDWITTHPKESLEVGYSLSRHTSHSAPQSPDPDRNRGFERISAILPRVMDAMEKRGGV